MGSSFLLASDNSLVFSTSSFFSCSNLKHFLSNSSALSIWFFSSFLLASDNSFVFSTSSFFSCSNLKHFLSNSAALSIWFFSSFLLFLQLFILSNQRYHFLFSLPQLHLNFFHLHHSLLFSSLLFLPSSLLFSSSIFFLLLSLLLFFFLLFLFLNIPSLVFIQNPNTSIASSLYCV